MSRLSLFFTLALTVLFGCGQIITISMPGGGMGYGKGGLPRGYERFLSPAPYNFRNSVPGEPVRAGEVAERYELREGDCVEPDCSDGRLRAEIRETVKAPTAHVGQNIWYGWSFYNESIGAVTRDQSVGTVIGQWKLGGDTPTVFRIVQSYKGELDWANCDPTLCNRGGTETEDVVAELEYMRVASNWGPKQNNGDICRLFSMAEQRGKWVDIVINTNFAADNDGYLRIWVNGVLRCNYFGRMVAASPFAMNNQPISHRRGIFASYTKPFRQNHPDAIIPSMVVYYDEFRSGDTRVDVDPAGRLSNGFPPKD